MKVFKSNVLKFASGFPLILYGTSISEMTVKMSGQPLNAPWPMLVTLLGMVIKDRPLQFWYLQVALYQRLAIKTVEKCRRAFCRRRK
jgi:hypothetical protein